MAKAKTMAKRARFESDRSAVEALFHKLGAFRDVEAGDVAGSLASIYLVLQLHEQGRFPLPAAGNIAAAYAHAMIEGATRKRSRGKAAA